MSSVENRRSPRLVRRVPLLLVHEGPLITAHTAVINLHGALVLSPQDWPEDTIVEMQNQKTGDSCKCRVVWSGGSDRPGLFKIGLEMLESRPEFWGADYYSQAEPAPSSSG